MTRQEKYPETNTFHYYNANPFNRITGDCWVRAISEGTKIPYNTVVMEMAELHCKTGYDADDNIARYLEIKGWIKCRQPRKANNTKYTGKEFCEALNKGEFTKATSIIANLGGCHIVCIKKHQGSFKVWDIWDSTYGCIGNYWIKR